MADTPDDLRSDLLSAIKVGDLQRIKKAIRSGADINKNFDDLSPLHWAIIHEKLNSARFLVWLGADLESEDDRGRSPIGAMVDDESNHFAGLILELLMRGANPNHIDNDGDTPIQIALYRGLDYAAECIEKFGGGANRFVRSRQQKDWDEIEAGMADLNRWKEKNLRNKSPLRRFERAIENPDKDDSSQDV